MIDRTFLEEDPFEQGVLVSQHKTFVRGRAMALLQAGQVLLMLLDGGFELFDVLGASLTESCLCLAVALLSLF